jgi:hypothetical protein
VGRLSMFHRCEDSICCYWGFHFSLRDCWWCALPLTRGLIPQVSFMYVSTSYVFFVSCSAFCAVRNSFLNLVRSSSRFALFRTSGSSMQFTSARCSILPVYRLIIGSSPADHWTNAIGFPTYSCRNSHLRGAVTDNPTAHRENHNLSMFDLNPFHSRESYF